VTTLVPPGYHPHLTLAAFDDLHRELHASYGGRPERSWDLYEPERWVPHCGLLIDDDPFPVETGFGWLAAAELPAGRLESLGVTGFGATIEFPLGTVPTPGWGNDPGHLGGTS